MALKRTLFLLFMWMTIHSVLAVDNFECPFLCSCNDKDQTGYDVTCNQITLFPSNIPIEATSLTLENAKFDIIPINAFENLPNLRILVFQNVSINICRACSFAKLENMASIHFKNCDIGEIQGNTFSNLFNITTIKFESSKIRDVSSYAFHNLKGIGEMVLKDSWITTIHSLAFQDFSNVSRIELVDTSVQLLRAGGFSKFSNVSRFVCRNTTISQLQCNTFDTILTSGGELEISDTSITCDCKLAWVWAGNQAFGRFSNESTNVCLWTKQTLTTINVDDMCPNKKGRVLGCPPVMASTVHTCSRGFDEDMEPVTQVTFPTYFSSQRNPTNDAIGVNCIFGNLMMCLLCMVVLINET